MYVCTALNLGILLSKLYLISRSLKSFTLKYTQIMEHYQAFTTVGILTFMSRKNSIPGLTEDGKC